MNASNSNKHFIFVLAVAGFASAASWRIADPIMGLLAADFQRGATEIALLSSAFAIAYALSQPIFGPLADTYGKSRVIAGLAGLLACSLLLSMFAATYPMMLAFRLFSGFCAGSIIPVSMALIGDRIPLAERQVAISRFIMVVSIGQIAGAALTGILADQFGWRSVFGFGGAIAAAAAAATFIFVKEPADAGPKPELGSYRENYRAVLNSPVTWPLIALFVIEGMLVHAIFPFVAPILAERSPGLHATEPGLIIGAFAAGIIAYTIFVTGFLKHLGMAGMMRAGGILMAASLLVFMIPKPWQIDLATMFVFGIAFYLLHNSLQTLSTEAAPAMRATAASVFAAAYFGGQALGPIVIGAMVTLSGATVAFSIAALGLGLAGLLAPVYLKLPTQEPMDKKS